MSRKQPYMVLGAALAMSVVAAGCGSDDAGGSTGLHEIEIAVTQWPSLVYSVPYHVAMEKGFFEDEGIEITGVVASSGGGTTTRAILTGDLAFGEAATSAVAVAHDAGAPLVAVGGGVQTVAELVWVAPEDSELGAIDDLPGHKAGFTSAGSVTQSVLAMSLERAGVDVQSVEMVATGGLSEGLTAMAGGGVDATVQDGAAHAADPGGDTLLWRASDLIEKFQQTTVVTDPALLESDPDLVRGFLAARARAVEYMIDNPEETAQIWAERGDIDPDVAQYAPDVLVPADEWGVGFTAEGLEAAETGMRAAGVLEDGESVPWDEVINQEFLPDDVERIELS